MAHVDDDDDDGIYEMAHSRLVLNWMAGLPDPLAESVTLFETAAPFAMANQPKRPSLNGKINKLYASKEPD